MPETSALVKKEKNLLKGEKPFAQEGETETHPTPYPGIEKMPLKKHNIHHFFAGGKK